MVQEHKCENLHVFITQLLYSTLNYTNYTNSQEAELRGSTNIKAHIWT
jgi:hypothetical protein